MTDYNTSPYWDDYNEDDNYHRILFKPGFAVQGRELTQMQTILQKQVERFGDHVFKEGSKTAGSEIFLEQATFVKLEATFNGADIDISGFQDYYAKDLISLRYYKIKAVDPAVNSDLDTLYVKLIGGTNDDDEVFTPPEQDSDLEIYDTFDNLTIGTTPVLTVKVALTATDAEPSGLMQIAYITEGVFYTNGNFVKSPEQRVVINKYSTDGDFSVGMSVDETIITSNEDTNLVDPANGAYNFQAAGADRQKFILTLISRVVTLDTPTNNSDTFLEVLQVSDGEIKVNYSDVSYNLLGDELARRTFDESGNYIVKPFPFRVSYDDEDTSKLLMIIDPGTAYVSGHEAISSSSEVITLNKARDTESVTGLDVLTYSGNYLTVTNYTNDFFDVNGAQTIELHNVLTPTATSKIGTAHIKTIEYASGTGSTSVFKLYLFDISLSTLETISAVRSVISGTYNAVQGKCEVDSSSIADTVIIASYPATSTAITVPLHSNINIGDHVTGDDIPINTVVSNYVDTSVTLSIATTGVDGTKPLTFKSAFLTDKNYSCSIFKTYNEFVKEVTSIDYHAKRLIQGTAVTLGVSSALSTNTPSGTTSERFASAGTPQLLQNHFQIVVKTVSAGTYSVGEMIDMSTVSVVEANPGPTVRDDITFTLGDPTFTGTIDVLCTLDINSDEKRVKTLVAEHEIDFTSIAAGVKYSLGVSDADVTFSAFDSGDINVDAEISDTDIADSFIYDCGHRDNYYDHASIQLKQGATVPTGRVLVVINYFSHSVGLGCFTAASYPEYAEIPTYTNTAGYAYNLRDSLDFRARRTDTSGGVYAPAANAAFDYIQTVTPATATANTDYDYYLARKDLIVIDRNGAFDVIEGVSDLTNPKMPDIPLDKMGLFVMEYFPFTYTNEDLNIKSIGVQRYTMKDIGSLDKRLTNVEYYTALNKAETEIANTAFKDASGNILINNGFLVDSYRGHSIGDVYNSDYSCSVDSNAEVLHPRIQDNATGLTALSGSLEQTGRFLTLPYTETSFINQEVASGVQNINPFQVTGFIGYAVLTPAEDVWIDTVNRPIIVVNDQGDLDALAHARSFVGTQWGGWNTASSTRSGDYLVQRRVRSGSQTVVTNTEYLKSSNTVQVASRSLPFVRSSVVKFELFRMAPNRPIRLTFDGINITYALENYSVSNDSYDISEEIITDANGHAKGQFTIPNNDAMRFPVGIKVLLFTDNIEVIENSSTLAHASFFTKGDEQTYQQTDIMGQRFSTVVSSVSSSSTLRVLSPIPPPPPPPARPRVYVAPPRIVRPSRPTIPVSVTPPPVTAPAPQPAPPRAVATPTRPAPAVRPAVTPSVYIDVHDTSFTASINSVNGGAQVPYQDTKRQGPTNIPVTPSIAQVIANLYTSKLGRKPDAGGMNYWMNQVRTGQTSIPTLQRKFLIAAKRNGERCLNGDPTAQSFLVSSLVNPDGVFLSSVDIFFSTKDDALPVTLELRPMVNGYPSASQVIPNSRVTLNPADCNIPLDQNSPVATTFTFESPIHLNPAEYAFVLLSDSDKYFVFIAQQYKNRLGTSDPIYVQPTLGSLFKSQNARTWTAEQFQDVMFQIKKCAFDTTATLSSIYNTNYIENGLYDQASLAVVHNKSNRTTLDFQIANTPESGTIGNFNYITPNSDLYLAARHQDNAIAESQVKFWMSTENPDVSPYVNIDSASYVMVKNLINADNSSAVVANPETDNEGGALSKYMTRKVTLAEDINATSLRVFLLENIQSGTRFEVFYKVISEDDSDIFSDKAWVSMTQKTNSIATSSLEEYIDTEYKSDDISYTSGGATFNTFKSFSIKVVMYSTNTAYTPTAKHLRVIALS